MKQLCSTLQASQMLLTDLLEEEGDHPGYL